MQQLTTSSLLSKAALLLLVLATLLPAISCSVYQNRTRRSSSEPLCKRHNVDIVVPYEGCEPVTTTIKMCGGICSSYVAATLNAPNTLSRCTCCQPSEYQIKVKKLMFKCDGYEELQEKRVFLPRVRQCGCVECRP